MEAIFGSTGQAVHVAFVIMSQPTVRGTLLRKALMQVMESMQLTEQQREWLDQLRGAASETVNFAGLSDAEVRAQCAMITQAVRHLPDAERWVLQAKYGYVEFEAASDADLLGHQLVDTLERAHAEVEALREKLSQARLALDAMREQHLAHQGRIAPAAAAVLVEQQYHAARDDVRDAGAALARAEATARQMQIAVDRAQGRTVTDGVDLAVGMGGRRFAFSAERIDAIKGLSNWMRPMYPRIKPFAIDCMLGRLFANHTRIGISFRDLAGSFGGNAMTYQRASFRMQNHLRQLEDEALARLNGRMVDHGVTLAT